MLNLISFNFLIFLLNSGNGSRMNSTPLAVKKKLQDHGLLDITSSPTKNGSETATAMETTIGSATGKALQQKQQQVKTLTNYSSYLAITPKKLNENASINNNSNKDSPAKFIQTIFSPVFESSTKQYETTATPIKSLKLTTPTKPSPSLLIGKKTLALNSASNEQDKSLDYSFEFREQVQKNSRPSKTTAAVSKSKLITSEKNLAEIARQSESFLHSPNSKKASQTNKNKKLKQLTMTQAFASQQQPTISQAKQTSKSINDASKEVDFDETCLPEGYSQTKAVKLVSIKPEPVS